MNIYHTYLTLNKRNNYNFSSSYLGIHNFGLHLVLYFKKKKKIANAKHHAFFGGFNRLNRNAKATTPRVGFRRSFSSFPSFLQKRRKWSQSSNGSSEIYMTGINATDSLFLLHVLSKSLPNTNVEFHVTLGIMNAFDSSNVTWVVDDYEPFHWEHFVFKSDKYEIYKLSKFIAKVITELGFTAYEVDVVLSFHPFKYGVASLGNSYSMRRSGLMFSNKTLLNVFSLKRVRNLFSISSAINNKSHFSIAHSLHNVNPQFYNPIPSIYVSSKGLPIHLFFTIYQLNSYEFNPIISKYVPIDFVYTVFVKVRYNLDEFFMAGNQFGFTYSSESDLKSLLAVISEKLEEYMSIYNLSDDAIVYIQVTFRQKDKKLLSEFSLLSSDGTDRKDLFHIPRSDLKSVESNLSIPVSIDEDSLGKALPVDISDGLITHIHLEIDGKLVNFLDIIKSNAKILRAKHKDNIISFDSSFKFYLLKDNTQKQTAKSILNNLLGRFGIRLEKSVTKVSSGKSFNILATRKAVIS